MVMPGLFEAYSRYYDLLYTDKDYIGEVDYVAATLAGNGITRGSLLEFGSGTGKHGRLLAAKGFEVVGIERSPEMLAIAINSSNPPLTPGADFNNHTRAGSFACQVGDIRSVRVGRTFDAVLALFHVVSYQTTNDDVRAVFASAADHLPKGGLFLFDVWHGPAVLTQRPAVRVKQHGERPDVCVADRRTGNGHQSQSCNSQLYGAGRRSSLASVADLQGSSSHALLFSAGDRVARRGGGTRRRSLGGISHRGRAI